MKRQDPPLFRVAAQQGYRPKSVKRARRRYLVYALLGAILLGLLGHLLQTPVDTQPDATLPPIKPLLLW